MQRIVERSTALRKPALFLLVAVGGGLLLTGCYTYTSGTERFLSRMDSFVGDLELNEEQDMRYKGIRARVRTDLEARRVERKAVLRRLKTEFDKPEPNVPVATADLKKQIGFMSGTMDRAPEYFLEFYNILNPAQQRKVNDRIRTRLNRYHYWHD
jgi:hypothetical protein